MASRKIDLSKRVFFVLSGVSNTLGKTLAVEMCRRFKPGSFAVLIETSGEDLQEVKKEIQFLENDIEVFCCSIKSWQSVDAEHFRQVLRASLNAYCEVPDFELAFILHNEGTIATERLMEPDVIEKWQLFVQENFKAAVALNREFLKFEPLKSVEKLVVNMTSSLLVKPLVYSSLLCSGMKARDMYFRAMAAEEKRNNVAVLSYSPGILASHEPEFDVNNNMIDLLDLHGDPKMLKMPCVKKTQTTLKLINILQEISFVSGHEVDYYDTFVL